jgi:hypothetical protein
MNRPREPPKVRPRAKTVSALDFFPSSSPKKKEENILDPAQTEALFLQGLEDLIRGYVSGSAYNSQLESVTLDLKWKEKEPKSITINFKTVCFCFIRFILTLTLYSNHNRNHHNNNSNSNSNKLLLRRANTCEESRSQHRVIWMMSLKRQDDQQFREVHHLKIFFL